MSQSSGGERNIFAEETDTPLEKDLLEGCVALRLVLALEGVKCLMN